MFENNDLKIEKQKLFKKIDNLEAKLNGEIPVDRLELFKLVNSWGRTNSFNIKFYNNKILYISEDESNFCYDLSKLDVSEITNMDNLFKYSMFNGDISKWNVSNVTSMNKMFFSAKVFTNIHSMNRIELYNNDISKWDVSNVIDMSSMFFEAINFNQNISKWDVSKVKDMSYMFANTLEFNQDISFWNTKNVINMSSMFFNAKVFNQNISKWNLDNIKDSYFMFDKAKSFLDKYNSGEPLPNKTENIIDWFNNNREKMNEIDIKENLGKEIDNFFSNIKLNIIEKTKNNL